MPALKDVESMITASRSRNMRFNFVIQNFSQLNKVYGKDVAETIKGNCGNMFYLITTEYAALEEISKLLGDAKPKEAKEGKPTPPIRPLVTVSDLQQMKKFEMIIKRFRNMPFKTKHKASFEIFKSKKGGWGYTETISGYPTRESKGIKTFDIKAFVDEHRTEDPSGFNPFGGSAFVPPFGLPNMNKGVNGNTNSANLDELVKNIDAQIARLEAEEAMEKGKNNKEEPNEFEDLVNKKYEEFISNKDEKESSKEENIQPENKVVKENKLEENVELDDLIKKIDDRIAELEKSDKLSNVSPYQEDSEQKLSETKKEENVNEFLKFANSINDDIMNEQKIEKPKINVDADSIIVDENITDDEFFDDFFGDD